MSTKLTLKKIVIIICFAGLMVIDHIVGSRDGKLQYIAQNCTGLLMAAVICTGFRKEDFFNRANLVWTVLAAIGFAVAAYLGVTNFKYIGQWITGCLNVWVYGYVVIKMIKDAFVRKSLDFVRAPFFVLWTVMFLVMIFSKDDSLWPAWFMVMFAGFYLTKYDDESIRGMMSDAAMGIIIGFFLIQGHALLFRPYDVVRYKGFYANENMNACMYIVTFAASLYRWFEAVCNDRRRIEKVLFMLLSGGLFGFVFMTMCRTALLVMFAVGGIGLIMMSVVSAKGRAKSFVLRALLLAVISLVSVPVDYALVRYMPTILHHPVWFAEAFSDDFVLSFDPADSPKYISFDEMMDTALGRIDMLETSQINNSRIGLLAALPEYAITVKDKDSVSIRIAIYKRYLESLNMWGHKRADNNFELYSSKGKFMIAVQHPHNILLQIGFSFGVIALVLFGLLIVSMLVVGIKCFASKQYETGFMIVVCTLTTVLFGMLEVDWRLGQIAFTILFASMRGLICKSDK